MPNVLTDEQRERLQIVKDRCSDPLADTSFRLGEQFVTSPVRADGSVGLSDEERAALVQRQRESTKKA